MAAWPEFGRFNHRVRDKGPMVLGRHGGSGEWWSRSSDRVELSVSADSLRMTCPESDSWLWGFETVRHLSETIFGQPNPRSVFCTRKRGRRALSTHAQTFKRNTSAKRMQCETAILPRQAWPITTRICLVPRWYELKPLERWRVFCLLKGGPRRKRSVSL